MVGITSKKRAHSVCDLKNKNQLLKEKFKNRQHVHHSFFPHYNDGDQNGEEKERT